MEMKVLTKLLVRDEEFYIVKYMGRYCSINLKYLDKDGKLTQTLNGLQMNAEEKIEDCITATRQSVEIRYLMSQGMPVEEAISVAVRDIR